MKKNLFEYMKFYYRLTNHLFPLEVSGKYCVSKKDRLLTIVGGYLLLFLSLIPFVLNDFFEKDILNQTLFCVCLIIMGLILINLSKFSLLKILVLYRLYKKTNVGFNNQIYEYYLYGKNSSKNTIFKLFINKYKNIVIIKKIKAANIYIKTMNSKFKICVKEFNIIVFKNHKKIKTINNNKLNNIDLYNLIISYIR